MISMKQASTLHPLHGPSTDLLIGHDASKLMKKNRKSPQSTEVPEQTAQMGAEIYAITLTRAN
jgi:hypothetical protein